MRFENADYNLDFNYLIDKNYELTKIRQGLIHSHCHSDTFFSNDDMKELYNNSIVHPFYLSIITNNNDSWVAKICIYGEKSFVEEGTIKVKTISGEFEERKYTEKKTTNFYTVFDCNVEKFKFVTDDFLFENRVNEIINVRRKEDFQNSKKYLQEAIEEFFNVFDYHSDDLFIYGEYDSSEYGPELLISYVNKYCNLKNISKKEIIMTVLNKYDIYNTSFARNLKNDYNEYLKRIK